MPLVRVDAAAADPQRLTERLRTALARGRFRGRRCVVSLPRGDVRLQSIRLPKMPSSELRQAATWEASQRFGLDRESMEADYVRTGALLQSSESREEILIVAVAQELIGSRLEPVLAAIRLYHDLGVWLEVTTLVIPGVNDSDEELGEIAAFLRSLDPGIPWHVSGFYPAWKMLERPPSFKLADM